MDKINLAQKLSLFADYWKPHIVGELNGQYVKLGKFKGPFTFHHHENEDEMFLVVKGRFRMDFGDRQGGMGEGEFIVVPRGVDHRPVAEKESGIRLFEPAPTRTPGNVRSHSRPHSAHRVERYF